MTTDLRVYPRKMFILRGLPGSGKSTHTDAIIRIWGSSKICSADHYFHRPDGYYDWNPRMLGRAHDYCLRMAAEGCEMGVTVIIDNTNIKKEHYKKYIELAAFHGYHVEELVIGKLDEASCLEYAQRNVHKVPLETILRMAKDFEP